MRTVYSKDHELHRPEKEIILGYFVDYKECPSRAANILSRINDVSLGSIESPRDFGTDPIDAVHSVAYRTYLSQAWKNWVERGGNPAGVFPDTLAVRDAAILKSRAGSQTAKSDGASSYSVDGGPLGRPGYYCYDMSGVIVEGTYPAAYTAAQVALTGAEILIKEREHAVFALCRPPGHHAHADLCGGYCFFNNAGIATRYLIDQLNVGKVAIIDIDVHHGNGSQSIFYDSSNPLYLSLHSTLDYPYFTGAEDEKGHGEGLGFNVNIPLPIGTQDEEYIEALSKAIDEHVKPQNPAVVVVSLGVDTFCTDPLGGFFLTTPCYLEIGRVFGRLQCPALFVMEGGYVLEAIGKNVVNVLQGFEEVFPKGNSE
ncbi:histone deacetylase superfamily protein [Geranomyces variabilis]|nr:histone deacetylase superfamily protein [Geranomyces variabilis]KAJ3141638.1 hypothetical protein HDU90_005981 [Geranomyces variabilis]